MKTLIVLSFSEEEYISHFKERFADELERDDVIFIENPKNVSDLERQLEDHQGEFDRVVVSTHGDKDNIPIMMINEENLLPITDLIKILNNGNEETLKKIHLTACFIGSDFGRIERKDATSEYCLKLGEYLLGGQTLVLHGDVYTGDAVYSFSQRLKGIVENKDYSVSEAVLDSAEAMSVVTAKSGNLRECALLETFSYSPFGRRGEEFTTANVRSYLSDVVTKAREFEESQGILNGDVSKQRLEDLSEEDIQKYLLKRFLREMFKAVDENHIEMVKSLIEIAELKIIDSNLVKEEDITSLIIAADNGRIEITKLLLANNADPNFVNEDGWTALMFAVNKGYIEITELLLANNADPNLCTENGSTALMLAAKKGYIEITELLLANNADPNLCTENGSTALMYAVNEGYIEITELLLKNNADPNLANEDGWTPLMIAANNDYIEIVQSILKNKETNPNLANKDGLTALMIAADKGDFEMVKYLIEKGADPEIETPLGETASFFARGENKDKITELLSQAIKKKQDATLEGWRSAFSSQELEEIREKMRENSPVLNYKRDPEKISLKGSEILQPKDLVKENNQYFNVKNPRLRGGEVTSSSTAIEDGAKILLVGAVGLIVSKLVTKKFNPTKTPRPKNGGRVKEEDFDKQH